MITLEQFNKQYQYKSDLEKYNTSLDVIVIALVVIEFIERNKYAT